MIGTKRFRIPGTRTVGLALAGLMAAGLAIASGTAFGFDLVIVGQHSRNRRAASAAHGSHKGFTKGFYDGHTVWFYYSKNFTCKQPPASTASSKCEGGTNYTQTPANTFDPLYVIVPLGFTPPKSTLQCPAGRCGPPGHHRPDLGARQRDPQPGAPGAQPHRGRAHRHQSEWWNVGVIVGVKSLSAWNKLIAAKSARELQYLQRTNPNVTGNITTNLFLYFAVK